MTGTPFGFGTGVGGTLLDGDVKYPTAACTSFSYFRAMCEIPRLTSTIHWRERASWTI